MCMKSVALCISFHHNLFLIPSIFLFLKTNITLNGLLCATLGGRLSSCKSFLVSLGFQELSDEPQSERRVPHRKQQ